ncbi:hypothetical protein FC35_GL001844 [Limosilactobacillus coleohominis DSM 14060]|nr:hypothetical protein FC35_GL001844 [Limosilactobacillus coleohominis DSM 14060]
MQLKELKDRCLKNLWAVLDLFAQESDFINGDRRQQIHAQAQRQARESTKRSKKD